MRKLTASCLAVVLVLLAALPSAARAQEAPAPLPPPVAPPPPPVVLAPPPVVAAPLEVPPPSPVATREDFERTARRLKIKGGVQLGFGLALDGLSAVMLGYGIKILTQYNRPATLSDCSNAGFGGIGCAAGNAVIAAGNSLKDLDKVAGGMLVFGGVGTLVTGVVLTVTGARNLQAAERVRSFSLGVGPAGSLGAAVELGF